MNDEAYTSGRAGFTLWLQGRGYVAVWRIFLGAELLVTIGLFGSRATSSKAVRRDSTSWGGIDVAVDSLNKSERARERESERARERESERDGERERETELA